MNKLKHEAELVKEALKRGMDYGERRGVVEFEATDSQDDKLVYVYRLLVHDGLIQPLARGDESLPKIRHKLAMWASRELPEDHPLRG